jgi:hypothetical protein
VDIRHDGQGLRAAFVQDVLARLLELSDRIGCRGLLVHAETSQARDFYRHLVPDFEPSPTNDLHLFLLMKDIRGDTDRHLTLSRHLARLYGGSITTSV